MDNLIIRNGCYLPVNTSLILISGNLHKPIYFYSCSQKYNYFMSAWVFFCLLKYNWHIVASKHSFQHSEYFRKGNVYFKIAVLFPCLLCVLVWCQQNSPFSFFFLFCFVVLAGVVYSWDALIVGVGGGSNLIFLVWSVGDSYLFTYRPIVSFIIKT